jgi:hypothetical protein
MDTQLDLTTASKETLLAIIAEQKAIIAQLQRRMAALEARPNTRGCPRMPGNKPSARQRRPRKEAPKGRAHGFARVRMTLIQLVKHAVEVCPECGSNLCGGWAQRTRE